MDQPDPLPASVMGYCSLCPNLQRVRAELEAAAGPFRTEEAIDKERQDFRSGDDRMEEMYRV